MFHQLRLLAAPLALLLFSLVPRALNGHEIPARVTISAWIVPRDAVVDVFVRVPLESIRDLEVPFRADSMLDLVRVRDLLPTAAATWVASGLVLEAHGVSLPAPTLVAVRLALPSDRAFADHEGLDAHFAAPLLDNTESVPWQNAQLDVRLQIASSGADVSRLAVRTGLAQLGIRTTTVLRLVRPDGAVRPFTFTGAVERVDLNPSWWASAGRFLREGIIHILGGIDHLLFVLCLVLPVRRLRPLIAIVTAFTVAHSLTLGAAALGWAPSALWFPPLVELLIAASILWITVENVLVSERVLERRWMLAFAFGLIHGFGFSFALGEQLQFAGAHLVTALAAFNVGVEIGQIALVVSAVPALAWARARLGEQRAPLLIWIGSAFIAHTAWHWLADRWSALTAFRDRFVWPPLDGAFALGALRGALLAAVALALALALRQILRRFQPE